MTIVSAIRAHWKSFLKIAVTIVGMALVLREVPLRLVVSTYQGAEIGWLLASLGLMVASLVVRAVRWRVLLQGADATIVFGRLVSLYFIGNFFNAFLPSGFGGDVVRVLEASQDVSADVAVGTVILDRLTGLMMLFAMALLTFPFRPPAFPDSLALTVAGLSLTGLIGGIILLQGAAIAWLRNALRSVRIRTVVVAMERFFDPVFYAMQSCGRRAIWGALAISFGFNLMLVGWWYAAGRAIRLDVPFSHYLLVIPILSIAILVPSLGGLGVREALSPLLFAAAGVSPEAAVALSLLVFVLARLSSVAGAPVYVVSSLRRRNRAHSPLSTGEISNEQP